MSIILLHASISIVSTLEKVCTFHFLKLFLIEQILIPSIEVMNSGHTLIIDDKLFLILHLVLHEWTEGSIVLFVTRHYVLVAHLLNCLAQTLHLFGT